MLLKLKCDNENIQQFYNNHTSFHNGDSGFDLFVPEDHIIKAGEISYKINLGISCEAHISSHNNENISYYLYPRSSTGSKTPLRLSNSVGIIDSGYRGNIIAVVDNVDLKNDYIIQKGSRLFQLCSSTLSPIQMKLVNELSETSRGNDGFGSTGH